MAPAWASAARITDRSSAVGSSPTTSRQNAVAEAMGLSLFGGQFEAHPDAVAASMLAVGGLLIVVAVLGKFVAGYVPFWFRGKKAVIGVGMIPRGEVGLIFAQMGLAAGVFDKALFSAVTLMVMVTTFLAPPLLRVLFPPVKTDDEESAAKLPA